MKKTLLAALCASTVGLGACGLDVPDLNNPSLETFQDSPTPSAVYAASTGLVMGSRNGKAAQNGYVAHLGILGRESYTFDAADPRFVTEMLGSPSLDPGSPAFGGNLWNQPYANIRNANTLLAAVDKVINVPEADKESIRGFAKTMQALDFLMVAVTRDTNGGPIDVGGDFTKPAPLESREALLTHVVALLDEGYVHLQQGGAFPFPLGSGFNGISFLKFNRAVKARAEVYRQNWAGALEALNASFIYPAVPGNNGNALDVRSMGAGAYYTYGKGSGDLTNGLTSPNIFAHPSIVTDAEHKPGCVDNPNAPFECLDNRVGNKIVKVKDEDVRTYQGLTSPYKFTLYPDNTTPLPIIRNEDLLLLRAEANIQLGNFPDAELDINLVRSFSGGLPPVELVGENALDILLYERRYSLLFEGGHRWIDMRRYNRLQTLPKDKATHFIHERFPIPVAETDARQ